MKNRFKIAILGESGVGKTNICKRIKGYPFQPQYFPTIAFDYSEVRFHVKEGLLDIIIWDLGGQRNFLESKSYIVQNIDVGIIVYDVRRIGKSELEENYDFIFESNKKNVPIMIVGNKIDLITKKNLNVVEQNRKTISKFLDKHKVLNIETSAKNLLNFELVQENLLNSISIKTD